MKKTITLNILIFLTLLVLVYSGTQVYLYYRDAAEEEKEYNELQENFGTSTQTPNDKPIDSLKEPPIIEFEGEYQEPVKETISYEYDWNGLNAINDETVGWLYIPDSYIDYPVVRDTNNEWYLKHSFEKKWNSNGCLFEDYQTDYEYDENLIIYGHNMIGNSTELLRTVMFSSLILWLEEDYFMEHNKIYYTRHDIGTTEYTVYASVLININDENKSFDYQCRNLDSKADFNAYIDNIKKFSVQINDEIIPEFEDKLLVLSTCYRPFDKTGRNGGRLVLFAIQS